MANVSSSRKIRVWLFATSFLIFSIVAVGGLTRLTRSGLSIVEWKPITGVLPPLNEEEWNAEFQKYQQFPEYQKINSGMSLPEFKYIFYWEYFHRLLARIIGLVFAIPLVFFTVRGLIDRPLARKLGVILLLGGAQGALGWFMVKSGLVDMPRVSAYRLAAHLGLALFLMSVIYWTAQDLRVQFRVRRKLGYFPQFSIALLALIATQIFFGALTAGLRAGHMYNTFPTMNGLWIPQGIGTLGPIRDFFENPVTVQFVHRCLGWLVFFSGIGFWVLVERRKGLSPRQKQGARLVAGLVCLQFVLGIFTLLHAVPVALGSAHQVGAALLLLATLNSVHSFQQGWIKSAGPLLQRRGSRRSPARR